MSKQVKKPAAEKKASHKKGEKIGKEDLEKSGATVVDTAVVDKEQKKADVASKEAAGATKSPETNKDTRKEKESLKSTEKAPKGMTFAEAEAEMDKGVAVKLPEWGGLWFKQIAGDGQIYVLTKEGNVVDTPHDEYKNRNDWQVAEATDEQHEILTNFWEGKKSSERLAKQNGLKAMYFNRGGGSFVKVPGTFKVSDLLDRKHPAGTMIDSEFLLENGQVFSVKEGRITNKDLSSELQILKKQK